MFYKNKLQGITIILLNFVKLFYKSMHNSYKLLSNWHNVYKQTLRILILLYLS